MPSNYKNTKIYYIPVGDKKYYGYTTQTLGGRKAGHKHDFKKHPNWKVYVALREINMSADDIELILVENYPCENKYQAKERERFWIEKDGLLNTHLPDTIQASSQQEYIKLWRQANKEKVYQQKQKYKVKLNERLRKRLATDEEWKQRVYEKNKRYREANKDKINEERRKYREANKDKTNERLRERLATDEEWKQRVYERNKRYKEANKDKIDEYKRQYASKKVKCDACGKEMRRDSITKHKQKSCKGQNSTPS